MSNSNLMNQVLFNKLDDDLNAAIKEVGGDVSGARGPWDYPEIIKNQLGPKFDIQLGSGLVITEKNGKQYINATSGAVTTGALNPPSGSYKQPVSDMIPAGTSIQEVFEILFYKVLPKISSVYKGDIIRTNASGADQYNDEDIRSGLIPNSVYLRLYVANRQEPVYILLSGHGLVNDESGIGGQYEGGSTDYIRVEVEDNIIKAYLTDAGMERFVTKTEVQSIVQNEVKEVVTDIPVMNDSEVDDFLNDIF